MFINFCLLNSEFFRTFELELKFIELFVRSTIEFHQSLLKSIYEII